MIDGRNKEDVDVVFVRMALVWKLFFLYGKKSESIFVKYGVYERKFPVL